MSAPRVLPRRLVLLGSPVYHSLSPRFQNAALRAAGIDLTYEALDVPVDRLASTLRRLIEENAAGNVTIPHKRAVFHLVRSCSEAARRAGAVNTFWVENSQLQGDNTDVAGFTAAVEKLGTARSNAVVALIGAGGAAAAVCAATESWTGATVRVSSRRPEAADALAARFAHVQSCERPFVRETTLLVNSTPVGMTDEALPCDLSVVPPDADVMDLVYRPQETAFVRAVRGLGHRALDGREMLLQQGARSFERWVGRKPDLEIMRHALETPGLA